MNGYLESKLVESHQGRVVNVMGNQLRVILSGSDTGGTLEFVELTANPGIGIPPHMHTREDEMFLVAEGQVEFIVAGKKVLLTSGATLFGSRNVPHGYMVVGDAPCRMYFTVTPATMESMFDEIAAINPPDAEKIGAICGRYGIEFLPQ